MKAEPPHNGDPMRVSSILLVALSVSCGACASIAPATLRLEPGASLRQATFQVDSVRYEGNDDAGRAAARQIAETLAEQLARRGHVVTDTTAASQVILIRALLAGYKSGSLATQLVFGAGTSPAQCVLRVTLVDRDTRRMVGEMVTTQSSGGRLSTSSKCAYSVAEAIDKATGARAGR